ncbi:MAG: hypothetical protein J6S14_21995 [Clostridia bacterium]|nr:hypothetical protein [Clostridia bacterium]
MYCVGRERGYYTALHGHTDPDVCAPETVTVKTPAVVHDVARQRFCNEPAEPDVLIFAKCVGKSYTVGCKITVQPGQHNSIVECN